MARNILIVDDSPTIRAAVSLCLRNVGYRVTEAKEGGDGLEKLAAMHKKGQIPCLIITDVNMPVMDGLTFIREIKNSPFRFLPILVFTTESEESIITKGRSAGAAGWLVKPFQPEQLLGAVKKLVWNR